MLLRLFPEILSHIMILAQESPLHSTPINIDSRDVESDDLDQPLQQLFEVTISHVNSQLRTIALDTPRLWSSIHVNAGVPTARTEAYLRRSGGHLLSLRVELNAPVARKGGEEQMKWVMMTVAQESNRWRELSIVAKYEGIDGVVGAVIARLGGGGGESLVPELQYLSISVDYEDEADKSDSEYQHPYFRSQPQPQLEDNDAPIASTARIPLAQVLLAHSPKLSFLRLRGLAIYLLRPIYLPALRILHLDQTKAIPITYTLFGRIVAACPGLEHLSVYGDITMSSTAGAGGVALHTFSPMLGDGHAHNNQNSGSNNNLGRGWGGNVTASGKECDTVIRMPELRSLRICGTRGPVYGILLLQVEAPRLTNLFLKDVQERDLESLWEAAPLPMAITSGISTTTGGVGGLTSHPASRFRQIHSLTISNSDLSMCAYRRLFRVFPSITEFTSYSSMEVDAAGRLLIGGVMGIPWPNLRTLTFIFDVDLDVDDVAVEEILKQRVMYGCPVHKLRIGVAELGMYDVTERVAHDAIVVLEKFDEFDVWPMDRRYPDIDDILF